MRYRVYGGFSRARVVFYILGMCIGLSAAAGNGGSPSSTSATREVAIGALLSLTGGWSSLGIASSGALAIGADDVNAHLASVGSPLRVRLAVEDTKLDPGLALEKLQALAGQRVKIVIGPQSSAEVQALKSYADQQGILLLSQGSTASTLSIPGDNILRFVPDDTLEGAAISALMWEQGIRAIVPLWRGDPGNEGLFHSTKRAFEKRGGAVADGVRYDPTAQEFDAALQSTRAQASQAVARHGAAAVGIYLAAFDEVVQIFRQVKDDPLLSTVRWYGSDGVAENPALIADGTAAHFAVKTGYPNPTLGLDDQALQQWKPLTERIRAKVGRTPDAYTLAAYDALWVAALAASKSAGPDTIADLRQAIMHTAEGYTGPSGPTTLNEAGDRRFGIFDFWAVCPRERGFQWKRVAVYRPSQDGPGTIIRAGGCEP